MSQLPTPLKLAWKNILFISLVFLFFFQLVSDFIESVYTFGLLGTNIPPEIVSVALFFSPALLFIFPKRFPRGIVLVLAGLVAIVRAVEVTLSGSPKMLVSGVGVGVLFLLLPLLLDSLTARDGNSVALEMGAGLTVSLTLSIFLRTLDAGSDYSLTHPWASWVFAAGLLIIALLLNREDKGSIDLSESVKGHFGKILILSIGLLSSLMVLYFAFVSPIVIARWTGFDGPTILLVLAAVLILFFAALSGNRLARISHGFLLLCNAIFVTAGTLTIWLNQTRFPAVSSAFPITQPVLSSYQQIPLWIMIVFCPVILVDIALLAREISANRPSPRLLAGSFLLGSLFFLLIVFAQVFTTVYDYIPVIGPWFRDRFWLVFLIASLGMALPMLAVRNSAIRTSSVILRIGFQPAVTAALLIAAGWSLFTIPTPKTPADQTTLKVLTYNIQQGYDPQGVRNYAAQLDLIRSRNPDIVGLQETDVARFSGGNADIVGFFSQGLGMSSYYGPKTVDGTFGIALLSRYPIENPHTFYMYSKGEQTASITANITVNGVKFFILVTHLGNGGPIIQQQQILSELAGQSNVIAMGDFNFDNATPQYALNTQSLADAWTLAGSPVEPGLDVDHLIDHIFVSPGIKVQSAGYIVSPASDHPAEMAEIAP